MKPSAPPAYQQPPVDPNLAAQATQATSDDLTAIQGQARGDSASLMARYGALMALAGGGK